MIDWSRPLAAGFIFGGERRNLWGTTYSSWFYYRRSRAQPMGRNLWGATYGVQHARLRPIYSRRLGRQLTILLEIRIFVICMVFVILIIIIMLIHSVILRNTHTTNIHIVHMLSVYMCSKYLL